MKTNIKTMISDMRAKQIPTDKSGNYWLRKNELGLHSQPFPKGIIKAHYEQMKSMQVPTLENEQYVLMTSTAKYLINANGDMFLLEEKRK